MRKSQRILAVINDRKLYCKVSNLLERSSFEVNRIPSGAGALILVGNLRYDLIMVEAPLPDLDFQDFVAAVRTLDSPCSGSAVLALACDDDAASLSDTLLGDDIAVLPATIDTKDIQITVSKLLGVAVRTAARILVQLQARVGDGTLQRVGQTVNISATGMLLSGVPTIPLGAEVDLEFELPGDSLPLKVKAEVVRHASPEVENTTGIGVRFIEISTESATRLRDFIDVQKSLPSQPGESGDEQADLDDVAPSVGS